MHTFRPTELLWTPIETAEWPDAAADHHPLRLLSSTPLLFSTPHQCILSFCGQSGSGRGHIGTVHGRLMLPFSCSLMDGQPRTPGGRSGTRGIMEELDPTRVTDLADLVVLLNRLHRKAGKPSLRDLERRTKHDRELLPGTRLEKVRLGLAIVGGT